MAHGSVQVDISMDLVFLEKDLETKYRKAHMKLEV